MEGYEVITFDDEKVGTVAGESGDFLIVEHGLVLKSKRAVLDHYGLAPSVAPGTEGFGVTDPGDPARSSEEQALRDGVEPAQAERARMRTEDPDLEESPSPLGDRLAATEDERRQERY